MDSTKSDELREVLTEVHAGLTSGLEKRVELDVAAFRQTYQHIVEQELIPDRRIVGILFGKRALFWFRAMPTLEFHVSEHRSLSSRDFSFLLSAYLTGATEGGYSFLRFTCDELRNWRTWLAGLLGASAALALYFGSSRGSAANVVAATIPAIALFASVFVLFTVSQRALSERDTVLLKSAVYHRYGQIDKYVAWILAAGLLAGVASLIGSATTKEPLVDYIGSGAFRLGNLGLAVFAVSWGITSLIGFYFDRWTAIQHLTAVPALKEVLQAEHEAVQDE